MIETGLAVLVCLICGTFAQLNTNSFPENLLLGVATSAYQVEGAWNESGKGEGIWDRYTHTTDWVYGGHTGDVACDAYHHTQDDVAIMKDLGAQVYRFSLSWSRILPTGFSHKVNPDGIRYYNELIDELLANDIQPMVTLYHWDLAQGMQDIGGWPNMALAEHFENYARVAFENFGDRVQMWITFNEPKEFCRSGYGGSWQAPGYDLPGIGDYLCAHTVLVAHAKAYHLYDTEFRPQQGGKIGISLNTDFYVPDTESAEDIAAQERMFAFELGWFADPIFTDQGGYPQIMKDRVAARSEAEGFAKSRLPEFTLEEIELIKGTSDFFGLNHYTSSMVKHQEDQPIDTPTVWKDRAVEDFKSPDWPGSASDWLKVTPWGFTLILKYLKDTYNNPEIYVTENGFSNLPGDEDDSARANYYKEYLSAMLDAIYNEEVNVTVYTAWSFMDNFEWLSGYSMCFGLYEVDFKNPDRPRSPKGSVATYKQILIDRHLNNV